MAFSYVEWLASSEPPKGILENGYARRSKTREFLGAQAYLKGTQYCNFSELHFFVTFL
jgi:hypothetical protein